MAELKFAVVREDYRAELALLSPSARRVLVVASGGCTALSLRVERPDLDVVGFDLNPVQLDHVRAKADAAKRGDLAALNVEDSDLRGLNQRGAFETLFRLLAQIVRDRVSDVATVEGFFAERTTREQRHAIAQGWFASPYWSAAFATVFNDALLLAMFGPSAIQHAEPGSYPSYFARVFENGLMRDEAGRNPFLQHVFLGRYKRDDAPPYVRGGNLEVTLVHGLLESVPGLDTFDLLSLSNVLDWCDDDQAAEWGETLQRVRPGAQIIVRQLNNRRDVAALFPGFTFDAELGAKLLHDERSLFYERIWVGRRA